MRSRALAPLLLLLCLACEEQGVEVSEDPGPETPSTGPAEGAVQDDTVRRIELADGLVVEVLEEGTGVTLRRDHDVRVHFRGRLASNGNEFDSSYMMGIPYPFTLGRGAVIKGWDRALIGLKVGTKARVHVPAELGYGKRGNRPMIPPNADLIFDIHVLDAR